MSAQRWQPTHTLLRAALVSVAVAFGAELAGRPDLLVLVAPLLLHAAVAVVRRPAGAPAVRSAPAHTAIREGEATRLTTTLAGLDGADHAVVATAFHPWSTTDPASGVAGADARGRHHVRVDVALGSSRWGRRRVGGGTVAVTGGWEGHRWGPSPLPDSWLTTLPLPGSFDSRAPAPHPVGVVGMHPSRRAGEGTEMESLRPFAAGDRLRRVRWPVSLRTGTLHVTSTVAEQDSSVLLLLDTATEVGRSGGLEGAESSLDVAVRAAGAVAEHALRHGDRVALRTLAGSRPPAVPAGAGAGHLRRVLDTLARMEPGEGAGRAAGTPRWPVPAGAVVLVLSPMLSDEALAATTTLARRGLSVVVVDTLPAEPDLDADERTDLAWRLRLLEREALLLKLTRAGIPVVAWRGPGTLDEVLRRLARRSRLPRLVRR
ncbi:MAG: DUF58 domain-containing protein [Nocardioidaceae bacterium]